MALKFVQVFLFLICSMISLLISSERKFRFEIMGEHLMNGRKFYPLLVFDANDNSAIKSSEYFSYSIRSARWDKDNDHLLYVMLTNGTVYGLRINQ